MISLPPLAHAALRPGAVWTSWTLEPTVVIPLGVAALVYRRGLRAARSRPTSRRRSPRPMVFAAGLGLFGVALVSPLDGLSATFFSVHMVQHQLLMLVTAPLLVLARPGAAFVQALSPAARWRLLTFDRLHTVRRLQRTVTHPVVVLAGYVGVFWAWHLPGLYQMALHNDAVHAAEHASFLVTALAFWYLVLNPTDRREPRGVPRGPRGPGGVPRGPRRPGGVPRGHRRLSLGATFGFVFAALLGNVWLAAALTFATAPLYPAYGPRLAAWGVGPLSDQQAAGVVMWVPGDVVYAATLAVLFLHLLAAAEARAGRRDAAPTLAAPGGDR